VPQRLSRQGPSQREIARRRLPRIEAGIRTSRESDLALSVQEIPGLEKDQIGVEVKDGVLSLHGERKFEKEVKEENYHRIERAYGSFHRSFSLPSVVEQDKISAKFKDGVLEVQLPKKAQAKPKQIKVDVK